MCRNKWLFIPAEKYLDYGLRPIKCRWCNNIKVSMLVHSKDGEVGDYECYICLKDANCISKCLRCKM